MQTKRSTSTSPTLEELARLQGVHPVPDLEAWLAQLPSDTHTNDEEDPLETILRLRHELRKQETAE